MHSIHTNQILTDMSQHPMECNQAHVFPLTVLSIDPELSLCMPEIVLHQQHLIHMTWWLCDWRWQCIPSQQSGLATGYKTLESIYVCRKAAYGHICEQVNTLALHALSLKNSLLIHLYYIYA